MYPSKLFLIGLISVMCVGGAVGLLIPTESQAGQPDKNLNKHCQEVVPWRGVIPGAQRFVPTFIDEDGVAHAYCDRQTGLVLEQSPSTGMFTWDLARRHCANLTVGGNGQKGWRLLSMPELASLVDLTSSNCDGPTFQCLPDGHPFQVVGNEVWTATTDANNSDLAWFQNLLPGNTGTLGKSADRLAWCGRGPMSADAY